MTDREALAFPKAFQPTSLGLEVRGRPTFEMWRSCVVVLSAIEGATQWWIGDALNYGESAYGETYAQAVSPAQAKTWTNYAYVARAVPLSRRREDLSWSHHAAVAACDGSAQRHLLADAARDGLTVRQVRAKVSGDALETEPVRCPNCGYLL